MTFDFKKTGYVPPEKSDPRNFVLEKAQPVQPFPSSYMTDISAMPVFMQYQIPDCVENSITFVKKYHDSKSSGTITDYSRRFLAALTVKKDGFPIDNGTSIQNALSIIHDNKSGGICEITYFPDDHNLPISTFSDYVLIPQAAYRNAITHTIVNYAFLRDLSVNGLKNAIFQNGLVIVGAMINENWWTSPTGASSWSSKDILPIRPPKTHDPKVDTSLSGHCFVLYGYDEKYIYFVNSFSDEWADRGKGYFSIDEVPFIYEAAVIVDLTAEQITALKQVSEDLQQTENVLQQNPNTAQLDIITKVVNVIAGFISGIFQRG